jgi:hypothetical protein
VPYRSRFPRFPFGIAKMIGLPKTGRFEPMFMRVPEGVNRFLIGHTTRSADAPQVDSVRSGGIRHRCRFEKEIGDGRNRLPSYRHWQCVERGTMTTAGFDLFLFADPRSSVFGRERHPAVPRGKRTVPLTSNRPETGKCVLECPLLRYGGVLTSRGLRIDVRVIPEESPGDRGRGGPAVL